MSIIDWIAENKEWLFSGVFVAVIGWLFISKGKKQVQKGGKGSTNIQVGGNFVIKGDRDDE